MSESDIAACAAIVERADPDRFRAAMASPVATRKVLFPLYAFNVEVSRAPWVTAEPLIAEMRLQWWRDALGEIRAGGSVRRHEAVTPLANLLSAEDARLLDELVAARSWDIYDDPFPDQVALDQHLARTSGNLIVTAARLLGAQTLEPIRDFAWATGLANGFLAVPDWTARGRHPLPDTSPTALTNLAQQGLDRLKRARRARPRGPAAAAILPGWQTHHILTRAAKDPARITLGQLIPSLARSQIALMWQAATGRF
ncbi:MAG: squalene/phytoene synthase family protein [Paracoccaceae bacterium]